MSEAFKEHADSLNKTKNLNGRFCERPFKLAEIQREFYVYLCCPSWLPTIVGNCEKQDLMTVWNSQKAQQVRDSILDGSFRFCDHLECPRIQSDSLPFVSELKGELLDIVHNHKTALQHPPHEMALCYDESCNLACPSCRNARYQLTQGREYERRLRFTDKLIDELFGYVKDREVILRITGSGDPIASKIFRSLLKRLDGSRLPNLKIFLQTNGVMLTPLVWDELHAIHKNLIAVSISIDAASEPTYQVVRKYGNWDQLMKNLSFISELTIKKKIQWMSCNFVVQARNFHEMGAFVRLCKKFSGVRDIFFSFVNDWNTWSKGEYEKQCIWKMTHPDFKSFLDCLIDSDLADPIVDLGNLTEYRKLALGRIT